MPHWPRWSPTMTDWELCSTAPDAAQTPEDLSLLDVEWLPAIVPGTAAAALRAAGHWDVDDALDFDAYDWWWRATLDVTSEHDGPWELRLGGLATIADVWFDGRAGAAQREHVPRPHHRCRVSSPPARTTSRFAAPR